MTKQPKVLVFLFGSLGDTLVAIPALRAVRGHFGDAEMVLLQNTQSGNLVKASDVIPGNLIDRYLSYSSDLSGLPKISGFYRLWKELRREQFQSAVFLGNSERTKNSILRDKLFFRTCGITELIGFHAFSKEDLRPVDTAGRPAVTEHEAVRALDRLRQDGVETVAEEYLQQPFLTFSEIELEPIKNWLADNRRNSDSSLLAIAPGCKTNANAWPIENFIEIGQRLIKEEKCEILIVGGKAEVEMGDKMIEAWGAGVNAAGRFSVRESGMLLSLCSSYIGLDTGTTHLAAAAGISCFAIYGERNNPGNWFPLGDGHLVVFHPVECAGCRLFECNLPDHPCMNGISIDSVWKNLKVFMSKVRNREAVGVDVISV